MAMEEPGTTSTVSSESVPRSEDESSAAPGYGPISTDELIERWWDDHFPGSAIARDTQAWNVAHAAKEMLKRLLKRSI
jgi:hypothetical protein